MRWTLSAMIALTFAAGGCGGASDAPEATPAATIADVTASPDVTTSASVTAEATAGPPPASPREHASDPCAENRNTLAIIREQDQDPTSILRSLEVAANKLFGAETLVERFHMELVYEQLDERLIFDGTITARAPGDAYMQIEAYGQSMEMLVLANDVFFRFPDEEWTVIQGGALQQYYDLFGGYAESRGPIDLRPLVDNLRGASLGGHELIDGREAFLWDVESVQECVVEAAPDSYRHLGSTDGSASDVVKWQFLVDRESLDPRKIVLVFEGTGEQGLRAIILELEFLQIGGPVEIPAPPPDADVLLDPFLPQT